MPTARASRRRPQRLLSGVAARSSSSTSTGDLHLVLRRTPPPDATSLVPIVVHYHEVVGFRWAAAAVEDPSHGHAKRRTSTGKVTCHAQVPAPSQEEEQPSAGGQQQQVQKLSFTTADILSQGVELSCKLMWKWDCDSISNVSINLRLITIVSIWEYDNCNSVNSLWHNWVKLQLRQNSVLSIQNTLTFAPWVLSVTFGTPLSVMFLVDVVHDCVPKPVLALSEFPSFDPF